MRVRIGATLLAICGMIATTPPAAAWDYPGHRIVGMIAEMVLEQHYPRTHKRVRELLEVRDADGKVVHRPSLSELAVSPDCAKNEEEYCGRKPSREEESYASNNPKHRDFHFVNTPLGRNEYELGAVGTSDIDIVQMITYASEQLLGETPRKTGVKLSDAEAVWLLAHLAGDIHQPLHVGAVYFDRSCEKRIDDPSPPKPGQAKEYSETFGGNRIMLVAPRPAAAPAPKLHLYWDGGAVEGAMHAAGAANAERTFARMLAAKPPEGWETKGNVETWATQWVAEIMPLAGEAHALNIRERKQQPHPSGPLDCLWETELTPQYETWAQGVARTQLAKAGFRLAALLKAIFEPGG